MAFASATRDKLKVVSTATLCTALYKRGLRNQFIQDVRPFPEIAKLAIPPAYYNRPSAPTNLTLHQALDINVPIGCRDIAALLGDVIVGDAEGVFVIPAHLADEGGGNDRVRRFRHRRGAEGLFHHWAVSAHGRKDQGGFYRLA